MRFRSLGIFRHASLLSIIHEFPNVLPRRETFRFFFYRLVKMPPCMSYGQGAFRRGPTSVLPHATSMSIVQRLGHRALTGRGMGVAVHQHYDFRMHLELKGAFGSRSFERRLPDYKSLTHFCTTLTDGYLEGLCACVPVR